MAFAWVRTKNLLKCYFDNGEIIISLTMARFMRDRDEMRRLARPRPLAVAHATLDVGQAVFYVLATFVALITSREESPPKPLRFWIVGYALQCIVHIAWFYMEHWRRWQFEHLARNFNIKNVEYVKEAIFLDWWILGCYLVVQYTKAGSEKTAPQLSWLAGVFLCFDIFIFFFALLFLLFLGIVLGCCTPLLYMLFFVLGNPVYDDPPRCPFCECQIHKVTARFV